MSAPSGQPRLVVAKSPIHGQGLFAGCDISLGTYLGCYEGRETSSDGMHVLWVEQDDESWLGYDGSNELRYLNHSATPNCELDGQELYAARDIRAGEELTIDYGEWFEE
jgi:SET domain-containing protein